MNANLQRKLNRVLEIRTDSPEMLTALRALSEFYTAPNTMASRRGLRGDIERRGLSINREFLAAYDNVAGALDAVASEVAVMESAVEDIATRLKTARSATADLVADTGAAKSVLAAVKLEQAVTDDFLAAFTLTKAEASALNSGAIGPAFFKALSKARAIHERCKDLLRSRHHTAALEIMDSMRSVDESATARLFAWVQLECRALEVNGAEPSPVLRAGIRELAQQPAVFSSALQDIAVHRRAAMVQGFHAVLTRGGGGARPIDLHAHDPARYVGDMLAYLHQSVATERELILSLFLSSDGPEQEKTSRREAEEKEVREVIASVFDSVGRSFKVAFDQVLVGRPSTTVTWTLISLLDFYTTTITPLLVSKGDGKGAGQAEESAEDKESPVAEITFLKMLDDSKASALRHFYDMLALQGDRLLRDPPHPPTDLSPPTILTDHLHKLKDIMKTTEGSLSDPETLPEMFAPVLEASLGPLQKMCTLSATGLDPSDMAIFMINCLSTMQITLLPFTFTSARVESLREQITPLMGTLVQEQASVILTRCGVAHKFEALQSHLAESNGSLAGLSTSESNGMDPESLSTVFAAFYSLLTEVGAFVMPQADRLVQSQLRTQARSEVVKLIAYCYHELYVAIFDPEAGYEAPERIASYTPKQVRELLGVTEDDDDAGAGAGAGADASTPTSPTADETASPSAEPTLSQEDPNAN